MLMKERGPTRWLAEVRFDPGFSEGLCHRLRLSGCILLLFGLESGSPRVLQAMDKGIDIDLVEDVLRSCSSAGISVGVNAFVGFPSETLEEAWQTAEFIRAHTEIAYASLGLFGLARGSRVFRDFAYNNLGKVEERSDLDWAMFVRYHPSRGMTAEEAAAARDAIRADPRLSRLLSASGRVMTRAHHLFLSAASSGPSLAGVAESAS